MKPDNVNILTINGGSSSIKFAMYTMAEDPDKIVSGQIKRIGLKDTEFIVTKVADNAAHQTKIVAMNFKEATQFLTNWLMKQKPFEQVRCVGHRIVHGIEHLHPEIIDDNLLNQLQKITAYDPDHLPAEIEIIQLFREQFPTIMQVACFDTSFHTTIPRVASILPVPRRFDKAGVKRYGFHGLSYTYLIEALKKIKGIENVKGRTILAHLGNGASLAAVKDGKSVDTSMGFTPAGGLVMGTRPGDIDPGIAWYIMQSEQLTPDQFNYLINHEAGLLGVSEISSDMQDLLKREHSDLRAAEAVELFCYQVKKWIGAFTAVLNGLETLVFSGGIGENAPIIRSRICTGINCLGIEIDEEENNKNAVIISTRRSRVTVLVIPTNEEIMIAKATVALYRKAQR